MKNIIKLSIIFALLAFSTGCAQEEPVVEQDFTKHEKGFTEGGATWSANLTASPVEEQKVGDQSFSSSTKASVSWVHTSMIMEAYKIIATDTTNNSTITVTVDGGQTSTELTGLKASTTYEIIGYGCMNAQCEDPLFSDPTSFTTDEEVWQLQGEGDSFETVTSVVENGNTLPYVVAYGSEAGKDLEGSIKFYSTKRSAAVGERGSLSSAIQSKEGTEIENLSSFNWNHMIFQNTCDRMQEECPEDHLEFTAFQLLPMANERAKLCLEAGESEKEGKPVRIYCLDSEDAYIMEDFNTDPNNDECGETNDDYTKGGVCEFKVAIGMEGDDEKGDSAMDHVRQFKVGYAKRDSWLWDEAIGTYMVITGDSDCLDNDDSLYYAHWDGSDWKVVQEDGCATPLISNAHGPVIVHLGGTQYKLYYEYYDLGDPEPNKDLGMQRMESMIDGKPFRVIYGDSALTGDPEVMELEDWETAQEARDITFLWPNGEKVDKYQEAGLGDHFILVPTNDLDYQVMYMNLNGFDNTEAPSGSKGTGIALLLNP